MNNCPDGGHCLNEDALERAAYVEVLAREMADYVRRALVKWDMGEGYYCAECKAKWPDVVTINTEEDMASLIHASTCVIARAKKLGLLE